MPLSFILQNETVALVLVLFLIFIVLAYKTIKLVTKAIIIATLSAIFPLALNLISPGLVDITLKTILYFMLIGVGAYFLYSISYMFIKLCETIGRIVLFPFRLLYSLIRGFVETRRHAVKTEKREEKTFKPNLKVLRKKKKEEN